MAADRSFVDRFLRFVGHPIVTFIPLIAVVLVYQAVLPSPRLGIDSLWSAGLRTLVGVIAVIPVLIALAFHTLREHLAGEAPSMPMGSVFRQALIGAALALVLAWQLQAALTPFLAASAFVVTVVWIWVTGVVAGYMSARALEILDRRSA